MTPVQVAQIELQLLLVRMSLTNLQTALAKIGRKEKPTRQKTS